MAKRVCVIGAGRWGRNHIRTLAGIGCLGGVVEVTEELRRELAEAYPEARVFGSVDEALDHGFDGFTVATPAESHYRIARQVIEHDRPVLVEKPMALTSAHARELRDLARRRGVNLMVGHVMLFHPAVRRIKQLIDQGKIGKHQYIYSNRLNLGTVRTEENILWSFAPHDISLFQYLIGEQPLEVLSRGGAFVQPQTQAAG